MRLHRWLGIAVAAAALGCGAGGEEERQAPEVRVHTATATLQAVPQVVTAIGSVAPRPGKCAALGAPAASRVEHIFVEPGQTVAVGAPLVELERAPFAAAARSAEAALAKAQHAYDRAVRLSQSGILPRKEVDEAASALAEAQVTLVTARRAEELAMLRAPLDGVVTRMSAVLGAWVESNQPLVEIADPSALELVVHVSPADAALVLPGAAVEALDSSGGAFLGTGAVAAVAAEVDAATRTVAVRARLDHPERALRIGETVTARITTSLHPEAVTVPARALVPEGEDFRVFVVGADGLAHARTVAVGARRDSLVEVTRGVAAGETVVTDGAYGVEDGARVVGRP